MGPTPEGPLVPHEPELWGGKKGGRSAIPKVPRDPLGKGDMAHFGGKIPGGRLRHLHPNKKNGRFLRGGAGRGLGRARPVPVLLAAGRGENHLGEVRFLGPGEWDPLV